MRRVLLVAADEAELAGFARRLGCYTRLQWPIDYAAYGEWGGNGFLLAANGAGMRLAEEVLAAAEARGRADAVVSTGYCGGLSPHLEAGEVFVATTVRTAGGGERYAALVPRTGRRHRKGVLISGDRVIRATEEKLSLHAQGGDAVDMEAAAVARRAHEWAAPFYCVRAVTDTAGESLVCDLNAARDSEGRIRRLRVAASALRRPASGLPELLRLYRRSRLATSVLGSFLADCEF